MSAEQEALRREVERRDAEKWHECTVWCAENRNKCPIPPLTDSQISALGEWLWKIAGEAS